MTRWVSKQEATKLTGLCARTLDNRRADGTLPYAKIGKSVRFAETDLEKFMMGRRIAVEPRQ